MPQQRPFHVRGYSGGFPVWSGYDLTDASLARLETLLAAFAEMGGDVLDWTVAWGRVLAHVKLRDSGEFLFEVAKSQPERLDPARLPALDFSYYDPAMALARKHGVTRIETHMEDPLVTRWQWSFLDPALGKGRVTAGSPEAARALVWLYQESRKYFESHGFTGFFCKISDEIAPEEIPRHIATAQLVREAGWRPFTTITGLIARTAGLIEAMDPHCDEWQLAFSLKDDFLRLREERYQLVEQRVAVAGNWGVYTNGGAKETYAQRFLGEQSVTGLAPEAVESFELLEDGRPLGHRGGSAWGNAERGVVISGGSLRSHLWMSPASGTPQDHRYELLLRLRQADPTGEPLVAVDPSDEVWCYGGGSSPFRANYGNGYVYPLMTLYHGFQGFGQWAFYHWNASERVVWVDDTNQLTISPVYCGYRDGWHDARLYHHLRQQRGEAALRELAGPTGPLRVDWTSQEVYRFLTVTNAGDPVAINEARRRALERLATPGAP
ncbi:MAG: hypothetical protein HUU35_18320 [Armatimonadetes bacterium]|nr:hypothetical protein [Armatimonadota bacterium]